MPDAKVSALAAAGTLTGAELVYLAQGNAPVQAPLSAVRSTAQSVSLAVGEWLLDPLTAAATYGQGESELHVIPRWMPGGTYDAAILNITTAGSAGAVIRVAVYSMGANGAPNVLLAQSAAVAATTVTAVLATFAAPFVVPSAGAMIYAGIVIQGGASTRPVYTRTQVSTLNNRVASAPVAADLTTINPGGYLTTGVTADPPSPWTSTTRSTYGPRFAFRKSA